MPKEPQDTARRAGALRLAVSLHATLVCLHASPALAAEPASPSAWRAGVAAEAGHGEGTDNVRVALVVVPSMPLWSQGTSTVTTFAELSLAHWRFPQPNAAGLRRITVIGVTPYLRIRDVRAGRWFFDFGLGLNSLSDLYEAGEKQFSTRFQFSDHLAVGRSLGRRDDFELSYRFVHYSNAGMRRPNPGVNFHMVRLERRFP